MIHFLTSLDGVKTTLKLTKNINTFFPGHSIYYFNIILYNIVRVVYYYVACSIIRIGHQDGTENLRSVVIINWTKSYSILKARSPTYYQSG